MCAFVPGRKKRTVKKKKIVARLEMGAVQIILKNPRQKMKFVSQSQEKRREK